MDIKRLLRWPQMCLSCACASACRATRYPQIDPLTLGPGHVQTRRVVSCHGSAANLPPETHVGHVGIIGIMIQLVGLELTRRCLKRTSFDGITSEKYISLEYFWILLILYWWSAKINNFDQFWSCASFKIENPWNTAKNERGGCSTGKSATYPITYCSPSSAVLCWNRADATLSSKQQCAFSGLYGFWMAFKENHPNSQSIPKWFTSSEVRASTELDGSQWFSTLGSPEPLFSPRLCPHFRSPPQTLLFVTPRIIWAILKTFSRSLCRIILSTPKLTPCLRA